MGLRGFSKCLFGSITLLGILLVSEKIISTYLERNGTSSESDGVTDIHTLEEWTKKVASHDMLFGPNAGSSHGEQACTIGVISGGDVNFQTFIL